MNSKILKIKRGVEANRLNYTPDEGELIVTLDTFKLFVGDGKTPGGNEINCTGTSSSKINLLSLEWNINIQEGVDTYSPGITESNFCDPDKGIYIVFYGTSKLNPSDYFIDEEENTITLASTPEEDDILLSIYYIGE